MLKKAAIVFITFFVIVTVYFFSNYTDRTITSGGAYGFKIGQSKNKVFSVAKTYFDDQQVYIIHPLTKENFGPHMVADFSPEDFELVKNRNMWRFYFEKGVYSNVLRLDFDEGHHLKMIHRHKQAFELM